MPQHAKSHHLPADDSQSSVVTPGHSSGGSAIPPTTPPAIQHPQPRVLLPTVAECQPIIDLVLSDPLICPRPAQTTITKQAPPSSKRNNKKSRKNSSKKSSSKNSSKKSNKNSSNMKSNKKSKESPRKGHKNPHGENKILTNKENVAKFLKEMEVRNTNTAAATAIPPATTPPSGKAATTPPCLQATPSLNGPATTEQLWQIMPNNSFGATTPPPVLATTPPPGGNHSAAKSVPTNEAVMAAKPRGFQQGQQKLGKYGEYENLGQLQNASSEQMPSAELATLKISDGVKLDLKSKTEDDKTKYENQGSGQDGSIKGPYGHSLAGM